MKVVTCPVVNEKTYIVVWNEFTNKEGNHVEYCKCYKIEPGYESHFAPILKQNTLFKGIKANGNTAYGWY